MKYKNIGYIASNKVDATPVLIAFQKKNIVLLDAKKHQNLDLLLVLGGDGFMIKTIHDFLDKNIPLYGINYGNLGFLLNHLCAEDLIQKIETAAPVRINLLKIEIMLANNQIINKDALNEVYIFRKSNKTLCSQILINEEIKVKKFVGDGIIISSAVGSSAYNYSAGGSVLPIGYNLINLTPINPFRPKKFPSIILPDEYTITLQILDPDERPVFAAVDSQNFDSVISVKVHKQGQKSVDLLFDAQKSLTKRMIDEQFSFT